MSPSRSNRVELGVAVQKSVKLTISSDHAAMRDVQDKILREVTRCGFDAHSQFAIRLALEEGLINAIKHGNRFDPKKKVQVEYRIDPRHLEVIIEDEGPGFARHGVPDPTLDENVEKCSGRGILLMEAYMNSVKWSHDGRRVRMVKNNEAEASI
jgi:serine/threonine-protein kinase RsbW